MLTKKRADYLFRYDPQTGKLYWKNLSGRRAKIGDEVGNTMRCRTLSYRQCSVDGNKLQVHRVIWLMHYGHFPREIDHIDGDGLNNRINNLRDVTPLEQKMNMPKRTDNTSGYTGITWHAGAKKWLAQAQYKGEYFYLGLHTTIDGALAARQAKAEALGFHVNHGR